MKVTVDGSPAEYQAAAADEVVAGETVVPVAAAEEAVAAEETLTEDNETAALAAAYGRAYGQRRASAGPAFASVTSPAASR